MRMWSALVMSIVAATAIGCGSDDESSSDTGTAAAPAALRGAAFDIVTVKPLIDFDVCAKSHPDVPCVKTDVNGNFKIVGLPADTQVLLVIEGPDYPPVLRTTVTGAPGSSTSIFDVLVPDNDAKTLVLGQIGVTEKADTGIIILEALKPDPEGPNGVSGVEGMTATISPASDGPFFLNALGFPDAALTSTSKGGHALVLNVAPGEATVTMIPPATGNCKISPVLSWEGTAPMTARVPVEAGYITYSASIECDP